MDNLLEYSNNYYMTLGSTWNYYRDEINDDSNENNDANNFRIKTTKQQPVNLSSIRQN